MGLPPGKDFIVFRISKTSKAKDQPMTEPKNPFSVANDLRRQAEAQLKQEGFAPEKLSQAEAARLRHELRVYQIELEMQNDDLRQIQARLEESRSRYADLYDFAPVGYLTLDKWGQIVEANLTAADILGVERHHLLGRNFWRFLAEADRRAFSRMMANSSNLSKQGEFQVQAGRAKCAPCF
jgi:PAS domain-containing protein